MSQILIQKVKRNVYMIDYETCDGLTTKTYMDARTNQVWERKEFRPSIKIMMFCLFILFIPFPMFFVVSEILWHDLLRTFGLMGGGLALLEMAKSDFLGVDTYRRVR